MPAETRSDEIQARETDPRTIIEAWGAFAAGLAPRASPIMLLIRDVAGSDPEVSALRDEMDADRHRRMRNARRLHPAGHLSPNVTIAKAADILWA